jgi:hypothetical protein
MFKLPIIVIIGLLTFLLAIVVVLVIFWRRACMGDISQDSQPDERVVEIPLEVGLAHHEEHLPEQREISGECGLQLIGNSNQVFLLDKLPATIGRSEENDVILPDTSVSSMHARIYYNERVEAVCIEDLASLNGVYFQSRPTCENVLDDGAEITLGNVTLTFRNMGYIPPQSPS